MNKDMIIKNIKEELSCLVFAANKTDYNSKESKEIEQEIKDAIKEDSTLDGLKGVSIVTRVDSMFFRCWLVTYKHRGFVLEDIGNCNWNFVCNADEAMYRIATKDFSSEYVEYK